MQRLVKISFVFADLCAWLLVAIFLFGAIAWPVIGPVHARMAHLPITTFSIVGTCIMWLATAAGAYAITRRQVLGLTLIQIPSAVWLVSGLFVFALTFTVVAAVIFGTPFLLAFLQARSAPASGSAV